MQRPGDNRWSMSIWARDLNTGKVKWIYQMTPHDEWDFDGVNEMILTDQEVDGKARKLLTHFDRNGFGYTLDRATGELLVADKYRSGRATGRTPRSIWTPSRPRPMAVRWLSDQVFDPAQRRGHQLEGHLPGGAGHKGRAARGLLARMTQLFYVPTNHVCMDYEPYKVILYRRSGLRRRSRRDVSAQRRQQYGQFHCLGRQDRQNRLVRTRSSSPRGAAPWRPLAALCSAERWKGI